MFTLKKKGKINFAQNVKPTAVDSDANNIHCLSMESAVFFPHFARSIVTM